MGFFEGWRVFSGEYDFIVEFRLGLDSSVFNYSRGLFEVY